MSISLDINPRMEQITSNRILLPIPRRFLRSCTFWPPFSEILLKFQQKVYPKIKQPIILGDEPEVNANLGFCPRSRPRPRGREGKTTQRHALDRRSSSSESRQRRDSSSAGRLGLGCTARHSAGSPEPHVPPKKGLTRI